MTNWKKEAERLRFGEGRSWNEMACLLQPNFVGMGVRDIREAIRGYIRSTPRYKTTHPRRVLRSTTGIFGDVHAPFNHPNYLEFVKDTFKQFNVKDVICTGDLVDHHALSRFQSDPSAKGAYDEFDASYNEIHKFVKAFPKLKMCIGNHDYIPERQAATVGIGSRYLKSFSELFDLPKTWEIAEEFIIDNVLYKHGLNCLGKDGAINAAINERMSTVIGHSHSFGGCKYSANKRSIIFGMNVGCGIDIQAYAFAYGKNARFRPTLGCGIVFNDSYAIFVPMGKEYFRS